jgi:hypothetical protein
LLHRNRRSKHINLLCGLVLHARKPLEKRVHFGQIQ